jgi:Rap1a immunity proteins
MRPRGFSVVAGAMIRFLGLLVALCLAPVFVREACAIDTPRQLAAYCETVLRGKEGRGEEIKIPNTRPALLCWGYMQAMQDLAVLSLEDGSRLVGACPPEDTTLLQLIQSFVRYARAHPADLGGSTAFAVIKALQHAYPCSQTNANAADAANG